MTVLLADRDEAYRRFLRSVLENETSLKVVAETGDGEAAVRLSQQLKPDLLLTDTGWPPPRTLQLIQSLKAVQPRAPKVVALSVYDGQTYRETIAKYGADGFLPKHASTSQIVSIIREVTSPADAERDHSLPGNAGLDLPALERTLLRIGSRISMLADLHCRARALDVHKVQRQAEVQTGREAGPQFNESLFEIESPLSRSQLDPA